MWIQTYRFLDIRILCRSTAFENQFTLLGLPDPSDKSKSGGRFNLTNLGRPTPGPPVNADTCDCDQVCRMKPYFYRQLQKLLDYGSLILATLKKSPQIFLLDVRMSVCKWTPIPSLNPVAEPWLRKFLSKLFFISRWNSSSAYLRSRSPSLRTRTIPPPTSSYKTFLIFPFSWGQSSTSTTNKVQFYKISLTCLNASLTLADKCSYFLLKIDTIKRLKENTILQVSLISLNLFWTTGHYSSSSSVSSFTSSVPSTPIFAPRRQNSANSTTTTGDENESDARSVSELDEQKPTTTIGEVLSVKTLANMFDFKSVSHVPTFKPSAAKLEDSRIFQRAARLCDESHNATSSSGQDQIKMLKQTEAGDIEVETGWESWVKEKCVKFYPTEIKTETN